MNDSHATFSNTRNMSTWYTVASLILNLPISIIFRIDISAKTTLLSAWRNEKKRDQLNNLDKPLLLIRLKNLEASSLVHFVYAYLIFVCIIQYVASIFTFSWLFSVFLQLLFSRLYFLSFEYYSSSSLINMCGVTHAFNRLVMQKSVHSAQKTLFIIILNSFDSSSFHGVYHVWFHWSYFFYLNLLCG